MTAPVSFTRTTLTDNDTLDAAGFNAQSAVSATVRDAAAGQSGVMPDTTTAAGLAMVIAASAAAQRTLLGLGTADSPTFAGITAVEAGTGDGSAVLAAAATAGGNAGVSFVTAGVNRWTNDTVGSADDETLRWRKRGANAGTYMSLSAYGLTIAGTITQAATTLAKSSTSLTNAAEAQVATLTNAPVGCAGNPTKWVPIVDNGTTRYMPAW